MRRVVVSAGLVLSAGMWGCTPGKATSNSASASSGTGGTTAGTSASSASGTSSSTGGSTGHGPSTGSSGTSGTSGTSASSSSSSGSHSSSSASASSSSSSSASSSSSTSTGSTGASSLGPSIDALVGINGFIDDPMDKLTSFGTVREYHNWIWDDGNGESGYAGYPGNQLQFSLWGGFWNFDDYYQALHAAGTLVLPCVQGSTDYLGQAMPPAAAGHSNTDPASYVAHADFMYQLVARYGSVAIADSKLKLAAGQARLTGANYIEYFEDGNEPDNNWSHGDGSFLFPPEVYAAMASADYDGDQGRLGATVGVKNADSHAKMVLAGLAMAGNGTAASNAKAYIEAIRVWANAHRGGSFPADVLNIHQYCFGPDGYGVQNPRPGLSPEECDLHSRLQDVADYRDQHLPGKELWLTEFGYDTDPNSNLRAPAIGGNSAQIVQAQWLVRSVLTIAESGIDRATLFVTRDSCSTPTCAGHDVQFTTSGVLTEKGQFVPKPSYFYLSTFRHALTGLRFAGKRALANSNIRVDAFADASGKGAYVVWSPTSTAATISNVSIPLPGATSSHSVALIDQSTTGQTTNLTISGGAVTVNVTETPLIILVDHVN